MDDRIKAFLDELESKLADLPENEVKEALSYYEEYVDDALDEGKSVDELLAQMDSPEKISMIIKAETSIRNAQSKPGLRNYSKVLKYAFPGITAPFAILMFSLFTCITYGIALLLFCGAFVSAAAACVFFSGSFYEAFGIPLKYIPEIAGTVGMGLFAAAVCLLMAYGLYLLCRLFIRLSTGMVGRMLHKSRRTLPEIGKDKVKNARSYKKLVNACVIAAIAGLVISLASGLPIKLFFIFNSMEPTSITAKSREYEKDEVKSIYIKTAQSHIRLQKSNSDKIIIKYEQPDWLEGEPSLDAGQLTFSEMPNGRLPLFLLVSLHENRTNVLVELPEGIRPEALKLESRGGFVHIETADFDVYAKTYSGSIFLTAGASEAPDIKASTVTGTIFLDEKDAGTKKSEMSIYQRISKNGSKMVLDTIGGNVYLQ